MYLNLEQTEPDNFSTSTISPCDIKLIAKYVACSPKTVKLLLQGKRGKRNTALQLSIRKLIILRINQNNLFDQECKKIHINE